MPAMISLMTLLMMVAPAAQPPAAPPAFPKLPPITHVDSAVNLYIELHNHLQWGARQAEDTLPEYRTEVKAYRDAKELSKDPLVMQIVNDACIAGPDIETIGKVVEHLPSSLAPPDQEAARKMIGALVSAWPRFKATEGIDRNHSLTSIWSNVLLRHWGMVEPRLLWTLYDKFQFKPIDAKITVYPVIDPVQLGAWGKTAKGYYLIIPIQKLPNLVIIEMMLHEVTHVLGDCQPAGSTSVLKRLQQAAAGADKETLASFTEGLVEFNAGELIRRFVSADYKPLIEAAPPDETIKGYMPTYKGPWVAYLEGKISADESIKGMTAALKPAAAPSKSEGKGQ